MLEAANLAAADAALNELAADQALDEIAAEMAINEIGKATVDKRTILSLGLAHKKMKLLDLLCAAIQRRGSILSGIVILSVYGA